MSRSADTAAVDDENRFQPESRAAWRVWLADDPAWALAGHSGARESFDADSVSVRRVAQIAAVAARGEPISSLWQPRA